MTLTLERLSLNQATTERSTTEELVSACATHRVSAVAPWRHQLVGGNAVKTRALLDDHGVVASSLCRGGFFTNRDAGEALDDNRRAVDEAATLGAPSLVLVCGPVTAAGFRDAEFRIVDGIASLADHAADAGVALAIEPFHPMLAAERSAVVTLAQAVRLARQVGRPEVGVVVDTYHVWWDPELMSSLEAATGLVRGVHVADWLVPTTDLLAGRGLPGDGIIDLAGILRAVDEGGYDGWIEVEVLSAEVWSRSADEVVSDIRGRMAKLIAEAA